MTKFFNEECNFSIFHTAQVCGLVENCVAAIVVLALLNVIQYHLKVMLMLRFEGSDLPM